MTIGSRIAQKRKELGLSQEALGEELGVSRQAIYKWESDAALPEIEKLVALSKRFGVSVGWLLGVEKGTGDPGGAQEVPTPESDGELSETQLKMVEEIVARYLAAQPRPKPRKKWPWVLLSFALLTGVFSLINRLDQINQQYQRVQMTVTHVQDSVNSQINGISGRVENILKAQNSLTAEYGTELLRVNLKENRAIFNVYAVPKTYMDGMKVKFSVDNRSGGINNAPGEVGFGQKFTGTLATQLTDSMALSAIFIYPDGRQETQLLDTYDGLLSASFPELSIRDHYLFGEDITNSTLTLENIYVTVRADDAKKLSPDSPSAQVTDMKLGIFRNQKLLDWAAPCDQPENYHGNYDDQQFYRLPDLSITHLTESDRLAVAALVTDNYGRQFMACDVPYIAELDEDGSGRLTYPSDGRYDSNPENWILS